MDQLQKKKLFIQLSITIGISVFFQIIIDPYIYNPYVRQLLGGFLEPGNAIVICSLSMWFFSFGLAYLYYRENDILTNYLICALIPLLLIVGLEFSRLMFWDFLHIPPIFVIFHIIWKYRSTIRLKKVAILSAILIIWATTVRLIGTNYTGVSLFPMGLIAIICWPLINLFLAYCITRPKKKEE